MCLLLAWGGARLTPRTAGFAPAPRTGARAPPAARRTAASAPLPQEGEGWPAPLPAGRAYGSSLTLVAAGRREGA